MNVTRTEDWQGLKKGDLIEIDGERGTFRFTCHVTREDGHTWVDAVGGRDGYSKMRSVPIHRVKPLGEASFGARLRQVRTERGWSRQKLAEKTGLTVSAIARIEIKGNGTAEEHAILAEQLPGTMTKSHDERTSQ